MFVKSYSISPTCHGKSFVPAGGFFKLSIDHLFRNLESGKRNYCFGKSPEKVLNFGSKIYTNPVLMFQRKKAMHLSPLHSKSDQHQFSPNNISSSSRVKVMRISKMFTKGKNALIFYQILSTNSLSKCMKISFENLSVDIGSLKVQHPCFHSPFCKLQILFFFF